MSSTSSCPTPSNKSPSRSIHHPYHTFSQYVKKRCTGRPRLHRAERRCSTPPRQRRPGASQQVLGSDLRASPLLFTFLYFALTQDIRADNPQRQMSFSLPAKRDYRQCVGTMPPPTVLLYRV